MRIRTTVASALIIGWIGAPFPALAGTPADRCMGLDPVTQRFTLLPTVSPDCLQIRKDGQLAPAGRPGSCLAVDPATKSMAIVDGPAVGSANCVRLDLPGELAKRVEVTRGPGNACFGRDAASGTIVIIAPGSPECVRFVAPEERCPQGDRTSGWLTLGRSTTVPTCLTVEPTTRTVVAPGSGGSFYDGPRPAWQFKVGVSYAEYKTPKVNTGTFIFVGPGSEVDAIIARQDAEGMEIDLSLVSQQFGQFSLEYFQGDATQTATEPMGGAQFGIVYHAPSPTDSLGINVGRSGGIVRLDTDHRFFFFSYRPPWEIHRYETEDCKYTLRPNILFGWSKTEYESFMQSIGVPGIYSEARQEVKEWQLGLGLRSAYSHKLNYNMVGRFALNLDFLYRDAELTSIQRNVCSAPGCSPSATFDATVNDSDSGVTWQAGVTFGLDYAFDKSSSIGVEAGYRYIGETAQLRNPTLTINFDQPPHLRDSSAGIWNVGASYRYRF